MIPVAVHGAEGRMGRLITGLIERSEECLLVGLVTEPGGGRPEGGFHPSLPVIGQEAMADELPAGCVVIDFSLAGALPQLLDAARKLRAKLVIGTTGYDSVQREALAAHARELPVVLAANFSIGIPTLRLLLQLLARTLPQGFDAEQVETHHVTKADRPSGTAKQLAAAFGEARGGVEVPTHSLRVGGVVGEHTWVFSDQEETLILTHRAHSRQAFLRGVLPAVRFVHAQERGLFGLEDVLLAEGRSA